MGGADWRGGTLLWITFPWRGPLIRTAPLGVFSTLDHSPQRGECSEKRAVGPLAPPDTHAGAPRRYASRSASSNSEI